MSALLLPDGRIVRRIQLRRTKGWRMPEGAVNCARPFRWGNPWAVNPDVGFTASDAIRVHYDVIVTGVSTWRGVRQEWPTDWRWPRPTSDEIREHLGGRHLGCWCELEDPCHVDVYLMLANPHGVPAGEAS